MARTISTNLVAPSCATSSQVTSKALCASSTPRRTRCRRSRPSTTSRNCRPPTWPFSSSPLASAPIMSNTWPRRRTCARSLLYLLASARRHPRAQHSSNASSTPASNMVVRSSAPTASDYSRETIIPCSPNPSHASPPRASISSPVQVLPPCMCSRAPSAKACRSTPCGRSATVIRSASRACSNTWMNTSTPSGTH